MSDTNAAERPIRHGAALVAGGAIGAGMFALPIAAADAWTVWTFIGLIAVCLLTLIAASILLQVHTRFELGTSFHTLVLESFGPVLAWINNISIVFIMLILMYAYITAGGRILQSGPLSQLGQFSSVFFSAVIATIVCLGASLVSRLSMALILLMAASFLAVLACLIPSMNLGLLTATNDSTGAAGLMLAIPVFVTAFACGGIVPSLVDYYRGDVARARKSVVAGSLLALVAYILWVFGIFALLGQSHLADLSAEGGGLAELIESLQSIEGHQFIRWTLTWFSHFAVITSFLSVSLGLVHFLIDRFGLPHNTRGRVIATTAAFLPPTIGSLFAPYGFVTAIAYAGFFVAFSFFIVPAMLYAKHFCWNLSSAFVMSAGILAMILKGWIYFS